MRTFTYFIESLHEFFMINVIGTMKQLKAVLGTAVDMTVYRKLRQLSYLTSYSHHGKYYALNELTRFDSLGLWKHGDARFSKYGTLINATQALVSLAEEGYTLSKLRQAVGCEVKETLLTLVRQQRIHCEVIDGQYVYFAASPSRQRKQHLARMKGPARLSTEGFDLLAHEVRATIILFMSLLDEKQRRLHPGLGSLRIGRGGDALIARMLDLDIHTVAKGRHHLLDRDLEIERVRRKGGGHHSIKKTPQIVERLQSIMKYETAGDPKTGLKWTRKATRKVARALQQQGIMVSAKTVARILNKMGYSLRANRKKLALSGNGSTQERKYRDLQLRHICSTRERFARQGEPMISVDTKRDSSVTLKILAVCGETATVTLLIMTFLHMEKRKSALMAFTTLSPTLGWYASELVTTSQPLPQIPLWLSGSATAPNSTHKPRRFSFSPTMAEVTGPHQSL